MLISKRPLMLAATLVPLIATAMPAPSAVATSISIADPRRVSIQ